MWTGWKGAGSPSNPQQLQGSFYVDSHGTVCQA